MTLLAMKTFPAFLWGIFIVAASTPETSGSTYTVEPNKTSAQLTTALAFHNKTDSHPAVWGTTHRPAATTVSAAAQSTVVTTVETSAAAISNKTKSSIDSVVTLIPTSPAAAVPSSSAPQLLHTSTALIETQPTHQVTMKETTTHAEDGSHPQSTTAPDTTAPATFSSTAAVSSPQPTSITESAMTSVLSSTFSSEKSTAAPGTQNLSSFSVSTARPLTAESISETTRVPQVSTSLPPTTAKTLKTSPEISSATQSVSASSSSISTQSNATSTSTESPNSTIAIIPFPRRPTVLPHPITKPAPATKSPHGEISKSTPSTEVQPCLTQNVVKQCLIVIACLALVCTIFIFTTIVLCAKLSSRKRKRKPQKETEMMCISALLPERSYNYTRQHNPVPNGVLVMPRAEDSDDEVGDNLTLSSFLPENDRYV